MAATNLTDWVQTCASEYAGLNLFMPKITGLTVDTYTFSSEEFCTVFAQTIAEIKEGEVDLGAPALSAEVVEPKKVKQPYGVMDYAKALQITAHELYIEKQRINLRNNCHNAAFMTQKRNKEAFC